MSLVLPLDGSITEVGETREAISKYVLGVKLMSKERLNSCPHFKKDVGKFTSIKKSSTRVM